MTSQSNKLDKALYAVVVLTLGGFVYLISGIKIVSQNKTEARFENFVNYVMGKVGFEHNYFTLSGRQIDREIDNSDFADLAESATFQNRSAQSAKVTADNKASKTADTKKVTDAKSKNNQTKINQKNQLQARVLPNTQHLRQTALPQRKPVQALRSDSKMATEAYYSQYQQENQTGTAAQANPANNAKEASDKVVKKSYEEVRQMFYQSSTKEDVMTIISSYKKGEINAADFYSVNNELLKSNDERLIVLALYALRLTPSFESYSMLVKYQPTSATHSAYVQEALMSYNNPSYLNILKAALSSSDKMIIMKSLEIINTGFTSVKSGSYDSLNDPRYRRDPGVGGQYAVKNYASFVPLIVSLMSRTQDQDILAAMNVTKNLISDSVVTVAQN